MKLLMEKTHLYGMNLKIDYTLINQFYYGVLKISNFISSTILEKIKLTVERAQVSRQAFQLQEKI
mgnify:CR=1 FL=1